MLVLTRYPGRGDRATICIGKDVEITILEIKNGQVCLAVTAPPACPISSEPVPAISASPEKLPGKGD